MQQNIVSFFYFLSFIIIFFNFDVLMFKEFAINILVLICNCM